MDDLARDLLAEVIRAASALGPMWTIAAILGVALLVVLVKRLDLSPSAPPPNRVDDVAPADPPSRWGENVGPDGGPPGGDGGGG